MPRNIGIVNQVVRGTMGLAAVSYSLLRDGRCVGGPDLSACIGFYLLATDCALYGILGLSGYRRLDRSI